MPAAIEVHVHKPEVAEADLVVRAAESPAGAGGASLATARVVVGGGRGVGGADGFAPLEDLAGLLGGVVGVSRVVTSEGWRPHKQQVGQTGTKITPELYLACGISGAIQHIAGCAAPSTSSRSTPTPAPPSWPTPTTPSSATSTRSSPPWCRHSAPADGERLLLWPGAEALPAVARRGGTPRPLTPRQVRQQGMDVALYLLWSARWNIGQALGGSMEHWAGSPRRQDRCGT